jgi:hypothetical protein
VIELTDEMRAAFLAEHEDTCDAVGCGRQACLDVRLAAVLAIVERDLSAGWLIWSNEHQMWWKSNSAGYTADMMCAGRYSLEAARAATGFLATDVGLPRDVIVRAPHIALIGDRDLAGKMREAVQHATRKAMCRDR